MATTGMCSTTASPGHQTLQWHMSNDPMPCITCKQLPRVIANTNATLHFANREMQRTANGESHRRLRNLDKRDIYTLDGWENGSALVTTIIVDGVAMLKLTHRGNNKLVALATYFVRNGQRYELRALKGVEAGPFSWKGFLEPPLVPYHWYCTGRRRCFRAGFRLLRW